MVEKEQDGIWIVDAEARTAYTNDRMAEILGSSTQVMRGQLSFEYVFPEDLEAAQRLFDFKKRGDSAPFHFKLRRKDGSAVWVNVQGTPMYNANREFKGIVGTVSVSQDQTEPIESSAY